MTKDLKNILAKAWGKAFEAVLQRGKFDNMEALREFVKDVQAKGDITALLALQPKIETFFAPLTDDLLEEIRHTQIGDKDAANIEHDFALLEKALRRNLDPIKKDLQHKLEQLEKALNLRSPDPNFREKFYRCLWFGYQVATEGIKRNGPYWEEWNKILRNRKSKLRGKIRALEKVGLVEDKAARRRLNRAGLKTSAKLLTGLRKQEKEESFPGRTVFLAMTRVVFENYGDGKGIFHDRQNDAYYGAWVHLVSCLNDAVKGIARGGIFQSNQAQGKAMIRFFKEWKSESLDLSKLTLKI
jgi:hypothetical protein